MAILNHGKKHNFLQDIDIYGVFCLFGTKGNRTYRDITLISSKVRRTSSLNGGVLQLHAGHDAASGSLRGEGGGGGGEGDSDTFFFFIKFSMYRVWVFSYITNLSSLTSMPAGNYKIHKLSSKSEFPFIENGVFILTYPPPPPPPGYAPPENL